jgi:hypothetical protein
MARQDGDRVDTDTTARIIEEANHSRSDGMIPHSIERQQHMQTHGHRRIAQGTKKHRSGPLAESSERGGRNATRVRVWVAP